MTKETIIKDLQNGIDFGFCPRKESLKIAIKALEQEPKTGHWIKDKEALGYWISECSVCSHIYHGDEKLIYTPNYCPNCGCHMVEPQESEE